VQKDDDIARVFDEVRDVYGRLDFLVHSIAFAPPQELRRPYVETTRAGWHVAMDISVYSLVAASRAAAPLMTAGGTILTISYYGGEKVVPGYNVMGVCKAALDSIVKYLAFDLGPRGIRVNAVSAGPLRTLAGRGAGVDEMLSLYEKMAPLGRNITHEEVGRTAGFLLSDMSDGITGELMHVDGGYNIMGSPGRLLDEHRGT
jgi:enoyl-[acyl-carrier protein] reductase I